jgi:lipid-binding SYLF domain-containing protein
MQYKLWKRVSCAGTAMVLGAGSVALPAAGASEQEQLVSQAEATFSNFERDPEMSWIRDHVGQAKAVMIAPVVRKAGFVVGGSGGRAVLLARDPQTGRWAGPAFYTVANASVGFQAGVERSEVVMLIMTQKAMDSLLTTQFKLGGDVSVAAGPVGAGAQKDVTTDVVQFSRAKGIYGGLNLDGTMVAVNSDWNSRYYGKGAAPSDILVRQSVTNPDSEALRAQIAQATTR